MTTAHSEGRTYEFGLKDRLRAAREMTGMSQKEFAEATGISRATIANYENGKTPPKRPNVAAWAMATGFSTMWLESGELPQDRDTQITHEYHSVSGSNLYGNSGSLHADLSGSSRTVADLVAA